MKNSLTPQVLAFTSAGYGVVSVPVGCGTLEDGEGGGRIEALEKMAASF